MNTVLWTSFSPTKVKFGMDFVNTTNFTNTTELQDFSIEVHITFNLLIFFLLCLPPLVINTMNTAAVLFGKGFKSIITLALINISASNIVYLVGLSVWVLGFVVRTTSGIDDSSVTCLFTLGIFISGSAARFAFVLMFAVLAYLIIKNGLKNTKTKVFTAFSIFMWLGSVAWGFFAFIPGYGFVLSRSMFNERCIFSRSGVYLPVVFFHLGISWVVWGTLFVLSTLAITIAAYCYINKNTVASATATNRAILSFSYFLVLSTIINITALLLTPTLFIGYRSIQIERNWIIEQLFSYYTPFIIFSTLSWITPLAMLYTFKQIREQLIQWATFKCMKCDSKGVCKSKPLAQFNIIYYNCKTV